MRWTWRDDLRVVWLNIIVVPYRNLKHRLCGRKFREAPYTRELFEWAYDAFQGDGGTEV